MEKKCCICGKEFNGFGNNPEPIMSGCCCDGCNSRYVIPVRLYNVMEKPIDNFEIVRTHSDYLKITEKLNEKNFEHLKSIPYISIYQNPETEETVGVCVI